MANVVVCLLTYKRTEYALATLKGLAENLQSTEPVSLCIADNGSPDEHVDALTAFSYTIPLFKETIVNLAYGGGYGFNYNKATQVLHDRFQIIIPLEDDWVLQRPFCIDEYVQILQEHSACIRLGNIGVVQGIKANLVKIRKHLFWELDPQSRDQYIFCGGPRIETVAWERAVGPWPKNLPAGEVELRVGSRIAARSNVLWPIEHYPGRLFAHIGEIRA